MFAVTDTRQAPCHVVNPENKKCARLNVIRHLLSLIPIRTSRQSLSNSLR